MRKFGWALIGVTALMAGGVQVAEAGVTCKVIPSWCSEHENKSEKASWTDRDRDHTAHPDRTPVPEPATLLLLGAGVTAVAAARRRKNNKDK